MTWVAAAIGGSAVLGYLGSQNQAEAAKSAAQTQLQGTQYAADIQKQMFDIGAEPVGNTQAQMAKQIADETMKFTSLAKAAKLSIE